ncbi:UNKNOWN [Stylonychia lemnae]|uniref:Uncharacterized protein n=1 Tax=Stylonychia lemnae TaxID=5949 RepID=A0A078AJK9_STYLE|nr:UNKNOWN [Stylonychia lemnae]|eukprot:CDW80988.1 UNKNOWN [Stylonychia lemnae]
MRGRQNQTSSGTRRNIIPRGDNLFNSLHPSNPLINHEQKKWMIGDHEENLKKMKKILDLDNYLKKQHYGFELAIKQIKTQQTEQYDTANTMVYSRDAMVNTKYNVSPQLKQSLRKSKNIPIIIQADLPQIFAQKALLLKREENPKSSISGKRRSFIQDHIDAIKLTSKRLNVSIDLRQVERQNQPHMSPSIQSQQS